MNDTLTDTAKRIKDLEEMLSNWAPDDPFTGDELSGGPACIGCGRDYCNGHSWATPEYPECLWVRTRKLLGLPTEVK